MIHARMRLHVMTKEIVTDERGQKMTSRGNKNNIRWPWFLDFFSSSHRWQSFPGTFTRVHRLTLQGSAGAWRTSILRQSFTSVFFFSLRSANENRVPMDIINRSQCLSPLPPSSSLRRWPVPNPGIGTFRNQANAHFKVLIRIEWIFPLVTAKPR